MSCKENNQFIQRAATEISQIRRTSADCSEKNNEILTCTQNISMTDIQGNLWKQKIPAHLLKDFLELHGGIELEDGIFGLLEFIHALGLSKDLV